MLCGPEYWCLYRRELLVINNVRVYSSGKTYFSNLINRQGRMWVLELDSGIVSPSLVKQLCDLDVNQDLTLPPDHALVSVLIKAPCINLDTLVTRALRLGNHAVLHTKQLSNLVKT